MKQCGLFRILFLVMGLAWPALASAEYPDHSIKVIVAWPPGGATDIVGRLLADRLALSLKQAVVVENRPGANGNIGTEGFVKMPPDGYALQIATAESLGINPHVYKKLGYDAERDFDVIALLAQTSFVLAVKSSLSVKDVQSFIALAKSEPGKTTLGNYGIGSTSHLTAAAFELASGAKVLHVPYRGLSPVINALLTGEIDAAFVSANSAVGLQQSGQLKILGAASANRLPLVPDVPTFTEQGMAGFTGGNWYGVVAPKGLAPDVKKRLVEEVQKIAHSDSFIQKAVASSLEMRYLEADAFADFLRAERAKWGEIVAKEEIQVGQ
ncbi:Bug family tripartite tricarboxylate transporter substrate binding protein [Bradyrhizobium sp.]|uniref:Bug family tripartite tricarboxylate transporter substrate binding protein n=1 Tax=Bradyrhizobium sp. TaxID=376 RepID=UPI0039E2AA5B